MLEFIKNSELTIVLLVLPIVILANILIGASMAGIDLKKHFCREKLIKGLTKGLLVYSSIIVYTLASFLMNDLKIEFMGEQYSLVDAIYVVILAAIIRYAKDGIDKLIIIMKYKEDDSDDKDSN